MNAIGLIELTSIAAGFNTADAMLKASAVALLLSDTFVIPNVHPDIFPAISGTTQVQMLEALGIVESFSVASLIEAADAAVKTARVQLMEIRLAMALGGKAFVTMTGDVASVKSAVDAAAVVCSERGLLVNKVVIPNPRKELLKEIV
ncbi:MAG: BMC domain-containing protein [Bacteroidota bacterium]